MAVLAPSLLHRFDEVDERTQWDLAPPRGSDDGGDVVLGDPAIECRLADAESSGRDRPANGGADGSLEIAPHRCDVLVVGG